jgi:RNA polymerase sigma-70 factor (ECF subfamily)
MVDFRFRFFADLDKSETGKAFNWSYESRRTRLGAAEDDSDVERTLAGDINAFEGIVRRWQGPLINCAYRFCGERGRAEDLAQEAFLRAYRSLGSWRRDSTFSTWLLSVAMNLYRSEYSKRPPVFIGLEDALEPRDVHAQDGGFEQRNEDEVLHRAVLALPKKYREAVVLFYLQDLSLTETAQVLHVAEGTLKVRLFRGREMLRKKLSQSNERTRPK